MMADTPIPPWLTSDFLRHCLQSDPEMSGITITDYKVEPAVPPGYNYSSHLFRVKTHYRKSGNTSEESINLIVKAPLTSGQTVPKESRYYNEFIPETLKISRHDIVPKHYASPDPQIVVMEDLKASGFQMVERKLFLDLDHCKFYIQASTKLQALSVALYKKKPDLIESIVKEPSKENEGEDVVGKTLTEKGLICLTAFLEDKPRYKKLLNLTEKLLENHTLSRLLDEMKKTYKPLKSFIQADPWCANMMFKYDSNGRVIAIKIFDFQATQIDSPVVEFVTFLWTSVRPDVRRSDIKTLYKLFCKALNDNLEESGCSERLSYEQFQKEVDELSPLVFNTICALYPFSLYDGVVDPQMASAYISSKITKENVKEGTLYKILQDPIVNSNYLKVLDELEDVGVIKYLENKINEMELLLK